MKIDKQFTVSVPIDRAWEVLTDLEGIAPCMPGAQITGSDGDSYQGKVRVKVGPVTVEYAGSASFVEKDDTNRRAVISAKGRESRGAGTASATITAQLVPDGDSTTAHVDTDLKITGKIAQFSRGMIAEVSDKLLGQFVDCIEGKLAEEPAAAAASEPAAGSEADGSDAQPAEPAAEPATSTAKPAASTTEPAALNLMGVAGGTVAKRLVPLVIGLVVIAAIVYFLVR
jgi:uncharacterized protein